mmetsp:Transcript_4595/g.13027  ORF Transcript_4595/g.13027 Transcript_4595/m.13027 type:complete len:322 (+) Transcript_4595:768-1733(+)
MSMYCVSHSWPGTGSCTARAGTVGTIQRNGRQTVFSRAGRQPAWVSCSGALHRSSGQDQALQALNDVMTCLRKNDLAALRRWLEPREDVAAAYSTGGGKGSGLLQQYGYQEGGVLMDFKDTFDLTSRRLLPSNLLRRSRVLSTIQGQSGYLVRMSVTAKSGEEGSVMWRLSSANRVVSCVGSDETDENCTTVVHPRHSPDAVLHAYMREMTARNFFGAQEFCAWNPRLYDGLDLTSLGGRYNPAYRESLAGFFADTTRAVPYHTLANSDEWLVTDGMLLHQARMVREVVLRVGPGEWKTWGIELAIGNNGCWVVDAIRYLN